MFSNLFLILMKLNQSNRNKIKHNILCIFQFIYRIPVGVSYNNIIIVQFHSIDLNKITYFY